MTYDTLKAEVGRKYIEVVELDLDFCTRTYGIAPCTASVGITGSQKCFNTKQTCQDPQNYSSSAKTYRFSSSNGDILKPNANGTDTAIPSLKSVQITPTQIDPSKGIGTRATISITIQDESSNDLGIDPYVTERTYIPSEQGTYWGKLLARNPFYTGRALRYKVGYWDEPTGQYVYQIREYIIDEIKGPDANYKVTITGKDVLKLADDKRAQAPFANTGLLLADITDVAGTGTLTPAGIGNEEYAASGSLRIDDEILTFTRIGDALTFTARGTDNTVAEAHSLDTSVQQCLRFTAEPINDLLFTLLNTYANIPAGFLDTVQWQDEVTQWLSVNNYTALLTEPNGVNQLLTELTRQGLFYIWWDEVERKILLKAIAPTRTAVATITDDLNVLSGSMRVSDDDSKRLSQIWVVYGMINPTGEIDKISNFSRVHIAIDSDSEDPTEYNNKRVRTIFSRWMTESDTGLAVQLAGRLLARFVEMPKTIEFSLDAADSSLWTGDDFNLQTLSLQDENGASLAQSAEVLSVKQDRAGTTYKYTAELTRFAGRYAFIGPNSLLDTTQPYELETGGNYELETAGEYTLESGTYSDATEANKAAYAYICYDSGLFLDGTLAYKII